MAKRLEHGAYEKSTAGAQVMCEVSKADIQDHVAERLEREAAEKERRRKEKMEAHLYLQVGLWRGCTS